MSYTKICYCEGVYLILFVVHTSLRSSFRNRCLKQRRAATLVIDKPLRPEECLLRCLLCRAASASSLSYDIKRVPNVRAFPFTATNGDCFAQDIDIVATTDGSGQFDREVIKKSIIDSDSR